MFFFSVQICLNPWTLKKKGRLWQKTRIEVVCCYVSHHPTVISSLSRLRCDNQKLAYFLVNSSCLYVLSPKFISCVTLTFRFNLTSPAEYILLSGVSHLVINFIWGITRVWCFISRITLVLDSNLLCHTLSFVASLFKFWQLGSALVLQRITPGSRLNAFGVFHRFFNPLSPSKLNDREEGVTTEINKQTQCDIRDWMKARSDILDNLRCF